LSGGTQEDTAAASFNAYLDFLMIATEVPPKIAQQRQDL
jgi:hypothetical protein